MSSTIIFIQVFPRRPYQAIAIFGMEYYDIARK